MPLVPLWPPHAPRAKLPRQPVDQPRQFPFARRLLDQAFLSGAQLFRPLCRQREGVEAELRVQGGCLVAKQALEMLRFAAWDRGCDRGDGDAAVDAIAAERQPSRAELALFELVDEARDQPLERLARRVRLGRGLLQLEQRARRRVGWSGGQRLRLAA